MRERRYIAILPRSAEDHRYWSERLSHRCARWPQLSALANARDLICFATLPAISIHDGNCGVILGELIRKEDCTPVEAVEPEQEQAIAVGGPPFLIREYWGSYIALLRDREGAISVLRAPLGDLPAYVWRSAHGIVISSEISLVKDIGGYSPAIDWIGISEHLIARHLRRERTCLAEIAELSGGTEGRWRNGSWRVAERWSPWNAVPERPRSLSQREAGEYLASVIRRSVAARTARSKRPLVLLSGGLDSSIVAACLSGTHPDAQALTMVTRDPGGDERGYAAATAAALNIPLKSVMRDVRSVDVMHSVAQGTPRPSEQSFTQSTQAAVHALARDTDIDAVFHGGGGDNVFCSLQSPAPAADRLLTKGPDRQFWQVASEVAALAQASVFRVAQKAVVRALYRQRPYRFPADRSLLTPAALLAGTGALHHRWLEVPTAALPGSASHIGLIVAAQSVVESPDPRVAIPWIGALVSQPIVEACVSIPSWSWYDRGCNRAAARHAFARALPEQIAWRQSKGAMNSFIVEIFEANRTNLVDLLLGGRLAEQGMIESDAVRGILEDPSPPRGEDYGRVMRLADAEAWVRSWEL